MQTLTHRKRTLNTRRNFAAIDIGTNSFHLIVVNAHPQTGKFRILAREKDIVRLGSSSTDMKQISDIAMKRGIAALKRFSHTAQAFKAPIRAVATSAVREAANKNDFVSKVKRETGIAVEIVSGSEEARLIYLGILQGLPVFNETVLCIDIGGGSTEFLIGEQRKSIYTNSLKLGAVRLTLNFFPLGTITAKTIKQCREFIVGLLTPVVRDIDHYRYSSIIGTSGTIENIARIIQYEQEGEITKDINGFIITRRDLHSVVGKIIHAKNPSQRARIKGLDVTRIDIIVAGAIILDEIFNQLKIDKMIVSDFAMREGIVLDTIEKKLALRKTHHLANTRLGSVEHLSEQCSNDQQHAEQVARLALRIFDQTKSLHKLDGTQREYLEAAALLHDIGFFISHSLHHVHTYYLVRNSDLLGFTENEKEIIANIARYHRKSHPKSKHENFSKLTQDEQMLVVKLSSILRIADGLDRTHSGSVKDIHAVTSKNSVSFRVSSYDKANLRLNIWGAEWKKGLFQDVFQKRLILKVR